MHVTNPGKINEHLIFIGTSYYSIYLIKGDKSALIDTGITGIGHYLCKQIKDFVKELDFILLTHSHYDHCGSLHVLKQNFPDAKICASKIAKEILKKPSAIQLIRELSEEERSKSSLPMISKQEPSFQGADVDEVLDEGDEVSLGRISLRVISTPGHTRCSLSYYMPEGRVLFSGDAIGLPAPGMPYGVDPSWRSDYDVYMNLLNRLSKLDIDIICFGHLGYLRAEQARRFFERSRWASLKLKDQIESLLREFNFDLDKVTERIVNSRWDIVSKTYENQWIKRAFELATSAQVTAVSKSLRKDR